MDPFLEAALDESRVGLAEGGISIGSVLVHRGEIIGRGHNRRVQRGSPILHAEMDALENAGRRAAMVYRESVLYTTLSPCAMCRCAIVLYRIPRVIAEESRSFMEEEEWLRDCSVSVEVVQDGDCVALMKAFVRAHPELWNEHIGEEESALRLDPVLWPGTSQETAPPRGRAGTPTPPTPSSGWKPGPAARG
jgi:cytosine deaminase